MNQHWARVKEVFHSALERAPTDRRRFVADAAGGDDELRAEVERLLAAHDQAGSFIEHSPVSSVAIVPLHRVGHYEIASALGSGAMGEVYRARDTKLNRDVALKVLHLSVAADPNRLARFIQEAHALAALNHPHIAAIYGLEDVAGMHALILELVEGTTLAEHIARGPMPIGEALSMAEQIADALEAAHEQGIVHRDVKPANIKVRADGAVKVLDFGLAKALAPAASAASALTESPTQLATEAGMILGTAAYMSPEQARGATADRRADVWAFGAVLYEMLTGAPAFAGATTSDTLAAVLKTEPDWTRLPVHTPIAIRRLLRRCLEKDQRRRLASMADARLDIQEALAAPPDEPSGSEARGRVTLLRALPWSVTAVCAVAVAFAVWSPERAVRPQPATARFQIPVPPETSEAAMWTLSPLPG
jgi:serine/threonine protein kinase